MKSKSSQLKTVYCGICLLVLVLAKSPAAQSTEHTEQAFKRDFAELVDEVTKTDFMSPRLNFAEFIQDLESQSQPSPEVITQWQTKQATLRPNSICQKIANEALNQHLKLVAQRRELHALLTHKSHYQGSFSDLPGGKAWYRHWLQSWLVTDVSIETLQKMAKSELEQAYAMYRQAQKVPYTEALDDYELTEHKKIVRAFREREKQVLPHLNKVFGITEPVPQVRIRKSNLPRNFPAPGVYNTFRQTFLYHPVENKVRGKHMDWLYIHEAIPGHHMQFVEARRNALCPDNEFLPRLQISSEGWAAYVETLAEDFGLFNHPESKAYALEWRVLRALRVLIDTGLHHEDWTEQQAKALWMRYLPHAPDVIEREIKRIRNWPAQVITYVYGKHLIEQAISSAENELANQADIGQREIRNTVLRLTNQPPVALNYISQLLDNENLP